MAGNSYFWFVAFFPRVNFSESWTLQIEAIPTICMAFILLFLLPAFPFSTTFLTPRERAIAQARLNRDHKPQSHGGMTGLQGLKAVFTDINCWMFMCIYASCACLHYLGNRRSLTPRLVQSISASPRCPISCPLYVSVSFESSYECLLIQ